MLVHEGPFVVYRDAPSGWLVRTQARFAGLDSVHVQRYGPRMDEEILPQLMQIVIDELGVHDSEVTGKTRLRGTDLISKSELMEIVMEAETHFGVEIPDDELERMKSLADLAAFFADELE